MRPECKICGHLLVTDNEQGTGVCDRCAKKATGVAVEDTEWSGRPKKKGRKKSQTRLALEQLQVGDCKRIVHTDIMCNRSQCSLAAIISVLRQAKGWEIEYYHEDQYVAVLRRLT